MNTNGQTIAKNRDAEDIRQAIAAGETVFVLHYHAWHPIHPLPIYELRNACIEGVRMWALSADWRVDGEYVDRNEATTGVLYRDGKRCGQQVRLTTRKQMEDFIRETLAKNGNGAAP